MEKITSPAALSERIILLEARKAEQEQALKQQLHKALEQLKPVNLIKNTVKDLASSEEFKGSLLDGALGLVAGVLAKKAVGGGSGHPIRSILGWLTQAAVSKTVAGNAGGIRKTIVSAVHDFLSRRDKPAS